MLKPEYIDSMTLKEINIAIAQRRDILSKLVGNLYPSIILEEISQLEDQKDLIEQILKNEGVIHG